MMSVRLLSTLAYVLFFSDGALSQDCAYQSTSNEFCGYVRQAEYENENILPQLKDAPFNGEEEYEKSTEDAQNKVREVLKKTDKDQLLVALKEALTAESDTLAKVKEFCKGKETSPRRGCGEVVHRFASALEALVDAVMFLPLDDDMRQIINNAYDVFNDQYYGDANSDYAELALTLAKAVAAAL
ncbi:unnamed protein product [Nippostrongylus brasiliensis]|uniref:Uncharacterized protein n=1 Tax=Nippostrongylus brasiliensis TaxID=27835 RepID=A0A0N4YJR3_NIPBR|nr:unnamed protein product [Nippostrongylus brasiliensis]